MGLLGVCLFLFSFNIFFCHTKNGKQLVFDSVKQPRFKKIYKKYNNLNYDVRTCNQTESYYYYILFDFICLILSV